MHSELMLRFPATGTAEPVPRKTSLVIVAAVKARRSNAARWERISGSSPCGRGAGEEEAVDADEDDEDGAVVD